MLQTSAIFKLAKEDGTPSNIPILILEARSPHQGARASHIEDLVSSYTREILPLMGTSAQTHTDLPAVGLECTRSHLK